MILLKEVTFLYGSNDQLDSPVDIMTENMEGAWTKRNIQQELKWKNSLSLNFEGLIMVASGFTKAPPSKLFKIFCLCFFVDFCGILSFCDSLLHFWRLFGAFQWCFLCDFLENKIKIFQSKWGGFFLRLKSSTAPENFKFSPFCRYLGQQRKCFILYAFQYESSSVSDEEHSHVQQNKTFNAGTSNQCWLLSLLFATNTVPQLSLLLLKSMRIIVFHMDFRQVLKIWAWCYSNILFVLCKRHPKTPSSALLNCLPYKLLLKSEVQPTAGNQV